jgi:cytochrome c5
MKKISIISLLILSGIVGFFFSWHQYQRPIPEPITDFGLPPDVQLIKTSHSPVTFVSQLKGDPDAGRKIFKEFCASCHSQQPLIDVPAPRIGDKKAWGKLRKIGIDNLLKITTSGVAAMPARGGCFECSDDQLRQAIQYILQESR